MSGSVVNGELDPAAEFLKREQDELGGLGEEILGGGGGVRMSGGLSDGGTSGEEDFVSREPVSQMDLVGGEAMIPTASSDDLFGLDVSPGADGSVFGAAQPSAVDWDVGEPALRAASPAAFLSSGATMPRSIASPALTREEPEKLRQWREEQKIRLRQKEEDEKREIEALRQEAQKALAEWKRNHEEQIAKTKAANRAAEKDHQALANSIADGQGGGEPGMAWDRVAKMCEFNQKNSRGTKDTSRLRGIILQLKQNPPKAPVNRATAGASTS